jgi:class 3 adenylate cyclase/tetratricopeptide (TPR) repeat protein
VTDARQVGTRSVLFTDLVGSTELRVRLGDEAADQFRRAHDQLLTAAVEEHGGTVVKGLGDGILATFQSAADAVSGAVAIQQAIEAHQRQADPPVSIRVGVSVGDVATEGGDVFGVPVVEASRLCGSAAGGEILVADIVRTLARGRCAAVFEPMGELALKGLEDPLPVCRVAWEPLVEQAPGTQESSVPIPAPLLGAVTSYVGRESLRDRIEDEWAAVLAGTSRAVLLAGEPGVGKTRTAAELARLAYADGALVLYGRCDEDLGVPYQPFVEALDHYVRYASHPVFGRLRGELVRLSPQVAERVRGLPPPVASDPASEEYRLLEATTSWLIENARAANGLLLILDDVHWATKPTLHLMQHLIRTAADERAPLLVVMTYRDTDVDRSHPLSAMLGDLRRLPGVTRLPVENLTRTEVLALIETAAGLQLDEPSRLLAQAMYEETEGNPFFVGEIVRHLIETGAVRREDDRWVVAAPEYVEVPEGVRDVVGRRLNRLSQTANDVLSVAAVIGREFEVDLLLAVTDAVEGDALDALDSAVRARLVEETDVDAYRFAHALVRTTLYEELSATRRRRLHRRVADVLEKLRPDDVRALAHHCTQAGPDGGDLSRAVRYTLAAAEQSLAARAFGDAEGGFRRALELLEDSERSAEFVAALAGLGEAQHAQGNGASRQTLLDASRQAIALNNLPLLQRTVLANTRGYASIVGGVDDERLEVIEKALELTSDEPTPIRARLLALYASELTFTPDKHRTLRVAEDAVALAESLGDQDLLSHVLATTAYSYSNGVAPRSRLARGQRSVELADASGDPTRRVVARIFLTGALFTLGELDESERVMNEAIAIADAEAVSPTIRWTVHANEVRFAALRGRLDDADALNLAVLQRGQELGEPDAEEWWAATASGLLWLRGHGGAFADAVEPFIERYPLATVWRTAHAWQLADAGRADEARAVLAANDFDPQELLYEPWPYILTDQLAMTAWHLGDADLAARCHDALLPYRGGWMHYYLFAVGPVSWALGISAATAGSVDEGVDFLDEALAELVERGCDAYAALLSVDLAKVLRTRNGDGDAERATRVLQDARERAERVGADGTVTRIDALLS